MTLLAISGLAQGLSAIGLMPSPVQLLGFFKHSIETHSFGLLGVATLVENVVFLNALFPFATVVLFGMASAHGNWRLGVLTFCVIIVVATFVQHANYFLGRVAYRFLLASSKSSPFRRWLAKQVHGLSRRRTARAKLNGSISPFMSGILSYWHPQIGSARSFIVGFDQGSYRRFVATWAFPSLFWNLFWGYTMYHAGSVPGSTGAFIGAFYLYLIGWTVVLMRNEEPPIQQIGLVD